MEVEVLPKQGERHDDTLGVPAGASGTPWGTPPWLGRLGLLPEGEVQGRPFLLVHLDTRARAQRVEALVGEQAVVVNGGYGEIDPIARLIGAFALGKAGDQLHHLVDEGGGVGDLRGKQASQTAHRGPPLLFVLGCDLFGSSVLLVRLVDDLVVDIGHVRDVNDRHSGVLKKSAEDVVDEREAAMADVRRAVDS